MKVSYATQVLSKTVAAALKGLIFQKVIKDKHVNATYNFVLHFNTAFDIFNIRNYGKNSSSINGKGDLYKALRDLQKYPMRNLIRTFTNCMFKELLKLTKLKQTTTECLVNVL
ncbi:hypothetical protein ACFFRR_001109 [Megaselia abdita]